MEGVHFIGATELSVKGFYQHLGILPIDGVSPGVTYGMGGLHVVRLGSLLDKQLGVGFNRGLALW